MFEDNILLKDLRTEIGYLLFDTPKSVFFIPIVMAVSVAMAFVMF